MDKDFLRFKWENDKEYEYRYNIHKISSKLHPILDEYVNTAKKIPDYNKILRSLENINAEIFDAFVPDAYIESDKYLRNAMDYYIRATKIMVEENKKPINSQNPTAISKAAKLKKTGTAFITITSCKNFEIFEKQQNEWNDKNEK